MTTPESHLEDQLIEKLRGLKYEYRADIRDRVALEANFREKFNALNHVCLTDKEFRRNSRAQTRRNRRWCTQSVKMCPERFLPIKLSQCPGFARCCWLFLTSDVS